MEYRRDDWTTEPTCCGRRVDLGIGRMMADRLDDGIAASRRFIVEVCMMMGVADSSIWNSKIPYDWWWTESNDEGRNAWLSRYIARYTLHLHLEFDYWSPGHYRTYRFPYRYCSEDPYSIRRQAAIWTAFTWAWTVKASIERRPAFIMADAKLFSMFGPFNTVPLDWHCSKRQSPRTPRWVEAKWW